MKLLLAAALILLPALARGQLLPDIIEPIVPPLNDTVNQARRAISENRARIERNDVAIAATDARIASAWISTPTTLSCNAGTLGSANATILSKTVGKTVFISVQIAIATNGTCATALNVDLPPELVPAAHNAFMLPGTVIGGNMVKGLLQSMPAPRINVRLYNNGYPGGSGANIVVSGVYQTP